MKQNLKFLFILGIVLGIVGLASAQQVNVWLPDTTIAPGTTAVVIPLYTGELTSAMNVMFYQFQLNYDEEFATATTPTVTGTITPAAWSPTWNVSNPGEILGGAWGFAGSMTGQGVLAYLNFNILPTASGDTGLEFEYFMYSSTGTPTAVTTDGSITISSGAPGEVLDLVIDVTGNTNIVLTWGAAPNAESYNIYRGTTAYFTPTTVYASTSNLTYTDTGAVTTGPKFYIVTAVN